MIITFDTETYKKEGNSLKPILDATGEYFILGCIHKNKNGYKLFYNRNKMWQEILDLARKNKKKDNN